MSKNINDIHSKLSKMNDEEIQIVNNFIMKIEFQRSEIDNDYCLNFDWLQEVENFDESIFEKSDFKSIAINWRTIKNVPR